MLLAACQQAWADGCRPLRSFRAPGLIGQVGRFRIYEIIDRFEAGEWSKRILVEDKPGELCELYSFESMDGIAYPRRAFLLRHSAQTVLGTRCPISGTGALYEEEYWSFTAAGPVPLAANEVVAAALKTLLPPGYGVWKGYGLNMERLCYAMPVWKPGDGNCCPTGGSVYLKFALRNGRLIVTNRRYSASADAHAALCPPLPDRE